MSYDNWPDWTALAAPFPDEEIKERPGRGSMTFRYIDARAVAQRLDEVLTPANWQFTCAVIPGTDIVKGTLAIAIDETHRVIREDHGYPNSEKDEEPIKAATSDALKRCAVLFGIGRHLYEDNKAPQRPQNGHSAPAPRPSPVRSTTALPDDLDDLSWDELSPARPTAVALAEPVDAEGYCPEHDLAWTLKPGGVSKKTGKPYDAFYSCPAAGPPYCNEKPTQRWISAHHP